MTFADTAAAPLSNLPPLEDIQAQDAAHHWHPFTDTADLNARGTRVIKSAAGCWLTEAQGRRLLDGMAGLWCVNVGYGRDEIVEAVARQMRELPYYNTFFQCTHPPATELAGMLAEVYPPHMKRSFFTVGGSDANDTAYRLAQVYWQSMGKPTKTAFIARKNAYHGSTVLGASLGGMAAMHGQGGSAVREVHHIDQPYWFGEGRPHGLTPEEFGLQRARALEAKIDELGEDNVAAFIAEPIQGAGGVVIPPETYWPEIKRICAEREILLIADEVISGFGRFGTWFGCQSFDFEPDMMSMAKGLTSGYQPMGAVAISEKVAEPVMAHAGEVFHGYTYSGHPAACAAAIANLRIIREEGLVERVRDDIGPYLGQRWASLEDHPLIGQTRSRGLIGAAELVKRKEPDIELFPNRGTIGARCRDICVQNGLVMRAVGDSMIISPPLIITRDEVDRLVELARKSFDDLADALSREGALA
ncbi:MAG: aspartate aminotransferase family protein [Pseudomonadota bacterium]